MSSTRILAALVYAALAASCGETTFNGVSGSQSRAKSGGKIHDEGTKIPPSENATNALTPPIVGQDSSLIATHGDDSSDGQAGSSEGAPEEGLTDGGEANANPGPSLSGGVTDGSGTGTGTGGTNGGGDSTVVDDDKVVVTEETISHRPTNAIAHCLEAWKGKHPFSTTNPKYRTINVNPLLGTAALVWDHKVSMEPELIYIHSDFYNPLPIAIGSYHLQNPNGWYCLDVNFDRTMAWQPHTFGSIIGVPVPSIGDVGASSIVVTCSARLAQVRHAGGDLARFVSVLRMHLLPPVPCFDGKDSLLNLDWRLPLTTVKASLL